MIEVYRKRIDSLDSVWHFHTRCPEWPETLFIQTTCLNPDEREHLCHQCKVLDAKMYDHQR
jgi:hypothetical protein